MNSTATYFKYSVLLVIVIAVIWFFRGCRGGSAGSKQDTVSVKIDTQYINTRDTITVNHPGPVQIKYVSASVIHDTLETIETILQHVDSARILAQYISTRFYDTTMKVKYGTLNFRALVTQNRIEASQFNLNQDIPQVKETVTLTQPKRIVLYFGVQAMGNKDNLPYAAGATIDLKLKNDGMIGIGGYLTKDQPMYSVGVKFSIKLRKR